MADFIKSIESLFVMEEAAEGTAETATATDAILAENIQTPTTRAQHTREYTGGFGVLPGKSGGILDANVSFDTELKGNGSSNTPEVDELLKSVLGEVVASTATTTVSGTSSTTTSLDVTDVSGFTDGDVLVMVETSTADEYEVALATDTNAAATPDTITVAPALGAAPGVGGENVYQMRTYRGVDTGHPSLTVMRYLNSGAGSSAFTRYVGCRGTATLNVPEASSIPKLSWALQAWSWDQATNGTRPALTYDTALPPVAQASKIKIDGTLTHIWGLTLDFGNEVGRKISQNSTTGVYGTPIVNRKVTGSFTVYPENIAHWTDWQADTSFSLLAQYGKALYGTVAVYLPKLRRTGVVWGEREGVQTATVSFEATEVTGEYSVFVGVG